MIWERICDHRVLHHHQSHQHHPLQCIHRCFQQIIHRSIMIHIINTIHLVRALLLHAVPVHILRSFQVNLVVCLLNFQCQLFLLASTRNYDGLSPFSTPYNRSCPTYPPGIQSNLSSGKTSSAMNVLFAFSIKII